MDEVIISHKIRSFFIRVNLLLGLFMRKPASLMNMLAAWKVKVQSEEWDFLSM